MKLIDNKQRRMSKRVKVTLTRLTAWQRAASFTSGQQTPKKESNYNIKVFSFLYPCCSFCGVRTYSKGSNKNKQKG